MKLQKNRKSNDHIHNIVAAFWNLYWKYKISRLKATWSKQSFYSDATSFLQWDRKFHMNAGWKSPHLAEPTHGAAPAHRCGDTKNLANFCGLKQCFKYFYQIFVMYIAKRTSPSFENNTQNWRWQESSGALS